jgi:hypothetical protein
MLRIAFLLAIAVSGFNQLAAAGDDVAERFRDEAPAGWTKLRAFSNNSQGVMRGTSAPPADAPPPAQRFTVIYRWNNKQGNQRFEQEYLEGGRLTGFVQVMLANQRYGCVISRRPSQSEFRLRSVERNSQKIRDDIDWYRLETYALKVDAESLDGIALDPSFKVINAAAQGDGDTERIEIKFESDVKHRRDFNVKGGRLVLSPSRNWAIMSYEIKVQYPDAPGISRGAIEYAPETIDGVPNPLKLSLDRMDAAGAKRLLHIEYEYSEVRAGTATAEDCSPTAFGLPEPDLEKPNP